MTPVQEGHVHKFTQNNFQTVEKEKVKQLTLKERKKA
jgi:hypothetical protein